MAHYALLDENNIVVQVITGRDETEVVNGISDWESFYGQFHNKPCKRTSYNTFGNTHLLGGTPLRGNYAGIGFTYDAERDVFIAPQPFASWTLNSDSYLWEPPTAYPTDGKIYQWDESTISWTEVQPLTLPNP